MRQKTPSAMQVVKKQEKEAQIRAFIVSDLNSRKADVAHGTHHNYLLIARSPDSPVVAALRALSDELRQANVRVRTVFACTDAGCASTNVDLCNVVMPEGSCRFSTDQRLLEAHEQLVLGPVTSWIGDCMRRDPAENDAYENYADTCAQTAQFARSAFQSFWRAASCGDAPRSDRGSLSVAIAADELGIGDDSANAPTAGTRH